jgi:hypothetical protein
MERRSTAWDRKGARHILLAILCIAGSSLAAAQPSLADAMQRASTALAHGQYLAAAEILRPLAVEGNGEIGDRTAFQLWDQVQVNMTGASRRAAPASDDAEDGTLAPAVPRDALRAIVARARRTSIVILNEDHVSPRQRAFALDVARALRPLGYDRLALETLDNGGDADARMAAIARRGYVLLRDGTYTREPVFGDFVRQALRLGYVPISYEDTLQHGGLSGTAAIEAREQAQAENLLARLRAHPRSRFLIYVGASHVAERPLPTGDRKVAWMAARLARLSGIDPLTIDQVTLGRGCRVCERLARGSRARPLIFSRRGRPIVIGQYRGAVDLQVFAPAVASVAGRPGWLRGLGRSATRVQVQPPGTGLRLVQAFLSAESADAIPVDQRLVRPGEAPPVLMLPPGAVRIVVQDAPEASWPG